MTDNQENPTTEQPDDPQVDPQPDEQPTEPQEEPSPQFGATRMVEVNNEVEVQVYTGSAWVSFEDMMNGDFSGDDGAQ